MRSTILSPWPSPRRGVFALLAFVAVTAGCGAAARSRAPISTRAVAKAAPTQPTTTSPASLPSAATPTAAPAPVGPPHRCAVSWWPEQEPALPLRDGRFVDVEGRCNVVEIRFDSVQWYAYMRVHRLDEVQARLARQDPRARLEVAVGRPPLGVARSVEELEAAGIPAHAVPRGFDFGRAVLVRYEAAHEPRQHCRDQLLGMSRAAVRAHHEDAERRRRRAERIRDQWLVERHPTVQRLAGADVLVFATPSRAALQAKPPGMCSTSYIWQPAIAVVPRSDAPLRVAER